MESAIRIYDRMRRDEEEGNRPLHRPKDWTEEERRKDKRRKKHNWSTRGGCIAPIMIPATPNSELVKMIREIAEKEAEDGLRFKIIETGGNTVKSTVQRSNPTATPGCPAGDCLACAGERGKGGNCRRSNVQYQLDCRMCPATDRCTYLGETSRNLYTRGREHVQKYKGRKTREEHFMTLHQVERHGGVPADFSAKVTGNFTDCLTRQVSEAVFIRRREVEVLNSKSEWHQPALWRVRSELYRE